MPALVVALLLALGTARAQQQDSSESDDLNVIPEGENEQIRILKNQEGKCLRRMQLSKPPDPNVTYCPMSWDRLYCWPFVPEGVVAKAPCPSYVHGFNARASAYRNCTKGGRWWVNETTNETWTDYMECLRWPPPPAFSVHVENIKLMSKIGYSLSFSTLLIGFVILASIKKLRCPRNSLHMQLFVSFIMRAFMFLLKDILFQGGLSIPADNDAAFSTEAAGSLFKELDTTSTGMSLECKVFTTFWQYFFMANYCWILMEGLYLHSLVFLAMLTDATGIGRYVLLGWGLPVLFVVPWAIVRATLEDTLCWTTNNHPGYFWIIRGPITASIIVNFVFFVNITRVLFLKMFSSQTPQARRYRYRTWFKSTLVLVPLFGVHYAMLIGVSLVSDLSEDVEIAWLYVDQLFSSFQGSIVAFLFCFCNGEVQSELRKMWQRWRESSHPLRSHHSILTQSLTYISKGRSSVLSLHSASVERRDTYAFSPIPPSQHGRSEGGGSLHTPALSARASQSSLGNSARLSLDDSCATTMTVTGGASSHSMLELGHMPRERLSAECAIGHRSADASQNVGSPPPNDQRECTL